MTRNFLIVPEEFESLTKYKEGNLLIVFISELDLFVLYYILGFYSGLTFSLFFCFDDYCFCLGYGGQFFGQKISLGLLWRFSLDVINT